MADVARWNPFDDLMSWWPRDLLTRLQPGPAAVMQWSPRCDLVESETEIVVCAELPGVDPADMEVTVRDGTLSIRGEKRSEHATGNGTQSYRERFFGSFERVLSIPATVDPDAIVAELSGGVLEVRLPKVNPQMPPVRKIDVRARPDSGGDPRP